MQLCTFVIDLLTRVMLYNVAPSGGVAAIHAACRVHPEEELEAQEVTID